MKGVLVICLEIKRLDMSNTQHVSCITQFRNLIHISQLHMVWAKIWIIFAVIHSSYWNTSYCFKMLWLVSKLSRLTSISHANIYKRRLFPCFTWYLPSWYWYVLSESLDYITKFWSCMFQLTLILTKICNESCKIKIECIHRFILISLQ